MPAHGEDFVHLKFDNSSVICYFFLNFLVINIAQNLSFPTSIPNKNDVHFLNQTLNINLKIPISNFYQSLYTMPYFLII